MDSYDLHIELRDLRAILRQHRRLPSAIHYLCCEIEDTRVNLRRSRRLGPWETCLLNAAFRCAISGYPLLGIAKVEMAIRIAEMRASGWMSEDHYVYWSTRA